MSNGRPRDRVTRYIGMIDKPYLSGNRDYLKMTKIKTWEAGAPRDLAEYSEFQKPYGDRDGEEDYPFWEWTFPVITTPTLPPITFPDPVENPCSIDEDCIWAGIIGPDKMECEQCFTWSQAHLYIGCDIAPWWAAFGSWTLDVSMGSGNCYKLFEGPVMATVCCDDEAEGSFVLTYEGPLNCQGSVEVEVSCDECCTDTGTTLTGADTVAQGATWTGTINPACTGFECRVQSNSGCVLSCDISGPTVTVPVPSGACGSFTVTVSDNKQGCNANANKTVRITGGGSWRLCGSFGAGIFCSGPWCGGQQAGPTTGPPPGSESHYYAIWCWGGGMCTAGDRNLVCDDGWAKWITLSANCCNGCQNCTNSWTAMSGSVHVWECTGACGT